MNAERKSKTVNIDHAYVVTKSSDLLEDFPAALKFMTRFSLLTTGITGYIFNVEKSSRHRGEAHQVLATELSLLIVLYFE